MGAGGDAGAGGDGGAKEPAVNGGAKSNGGAKQQVTYAGAGEDGGAKEEGVAYGGGGEEAADDGAGRNGGARDEAIDDECTDGEKNNLCYCANGRWLCTGFRPHSRTECLSGEKKKMGCASCFCSDFGKWLCTGRCNPGIEQKNLNIHNKTCT